jgi:hypothetical protein
MLQAGRSRVHFLRRLSDFLNLSDPSSRTMTPGLTQPLTEISTRNHLGVKARQAGKADNLIANYEAIV